VANTWNVSKLWVYVFIKAEILINKPLLDYYRLHNHDDDDVLYLKKSDFADVAA